MFQQVEGFFVVRFVFFANYYIVYISQCCFCRLKRLMTGEIHFFIHFSAAALFTCIFYIFTQNL